MIRASVAREVRERANESFRKYKRMKNEANNLIIFAANTGSSFCEYTESNSLENETLLEILQNELISLGYNVHRYIFPKSIKLHISWE